MKDEHRNANEHNNVTYMYLEQRMQETELQNWVVVSASMILWTAIPWQIAFRATNVILTVAIVSNSPNPHPSLMACGGEAIAENALFYQKFVFCAIYVTQLGDMDKCSSLWKLYCGSNYQSRVIVE